MRIAKNNIAVQVIALVVTSPFIGHKGSELTRLIVGVGYCNELLPHTARAFVTGTVICAANCAFTSGRHRYYIADDQVFVYPGHYFTRLFFIANIPAQGQVILCGFPVQAQGQLAQVLRMVGDGGKV